MNDFKILSARIGADRMQIQNGGGNTSLKQGDMMHVKASGTWLEDAVEQDIFAAIDYKSIQTELQRGNTDVKLSGDPRPSIETTFHAVINHPCIIHTHSVNTIALSCMRDAETHILPKLLQDFDWQLIPYIKPGVGIALEILRQGVAAEIYILKNHGVIFAGADPAQVGSLIEKYERTIERELRICATSPNYDLLKRIAEGKPYKLPEFPEVHDLALDKINLEFASTGVIYPDHAVFLGSEFPIIQAADVETAEAGASKDSAGVLLDKFSHSSFKGKFVFVEGAGVLVREDISRSAEQMLLALALVVPRIPAGADVSYLSDRDVADLLDWDAEKYRQTLQVNQ